MFKGVCLGQFKYQAAGWSHKQSETNIRFDSSNHECMVSKLLQRRLKYADYLWKHLTSILTMPSNQKVKKNAFSRIGARLRNEKPRDLRELTKVFNSYKALSKPIRILLSPWRFLSEFKNFQIELVCPHASDGIQIYQSLVRPTRLWAAEIQARFAFHTLSDSSWIYFLPLCRVI